MDIQVLASSSSGNCYRISDGTTSLLLECGIPIKEIQKGLGYRLSDVAACLITHEHKDHCKAVKDLLRAGIDVYMSFGTLKALGLDGHRIHTVKTSIQFKVGTFWIMPFKTEHDAAEPIGFLIHSASTLEKLVFITDSYYCKYNFMKLNYIMVECNYAMDILKSNIEAGLVPESLKNRLIESHFSLDNVKEFLKANDLSQVKEIYLLHLSSGNSDAGRFKREIQEITGKQVIIA